MYERNSVGEKPVHLVVSNAGAVTLTAPHVGDLTIVCSRFSVVTRFDAADAEEGFTCAAGQPNSAFAQDRANRRKNVEAQIRTDAILGRSSTDGRDSDRRCLPWCRLMRVAAPTRIPRAGRTVRHPPRSGWLDELGRLKDGRSLGLGVARCAPYWVVQNCPATPSAVSCSRMYVRTCSSSNPTVDTA